MWSISESFEYYQGWQEALQCGGWSLGALRKANRRRSRAVACLDLWLSAIGWLRMLSPIHKSLTSDR